MNADEEREDQALDALIVAAFRQEPCAEDDVKEMLAAEAYLSAEDRQALEALGPDLVAQILGGAWQPGGAPAQTGRESADVAEPELAGSMHRGDEESEITDAAREEMERKLRELEEDDEHQS